MSETHEVTAELPGTWYTRESPTAEPYVTVGGTVAEGDTVGLIEVMKMFNPVVSGVSGTVVEVCFESEDSVDVGDVLVRVEAPEWHISRLLVISRGEIAVRTIRAAAELGITTVAAYSSADEDSLAVSLADESVNIGGAQAKKSYLNHQAILSRRATKVDAIHPGYGFLSESADFAREVEQAGLIWVGPSGETIARMGDKATAIQTAEAAGVRVVPGSGGLVTDIEAAKKAAQRRRLSDDDQGHRRRRGPGDSHRTGRCRAQRGLRRSLAGGRGVVRQRWRVLGAPGPQGPPHRGADPRRRHQGGPLLRA